MTTTSQPAVDPMPPVGGLLAAVRRSFGELRDRAPGHGAGSWPRADREAAIGELDALATAVTLYRGQVLRAHEKAGAWGSVADRDFADYRSRTTGSGRGAATGEGQLAEGLEQLPALAEAVEDGRLNLEHAKALARLHRTASAEVKDALVDGGGLDKLLEQAVRDRLTAPDLGKAAKSWAAQIDAEAAQRDFEAVRRRRSLTMRKHAGGVAGEFFLDPIAGEQLRTALEAISGRPAADDDRTRPQRMADALETMAARTLQVGSDLVGAQVRPHLALLVSEQTWAGILARRRACESCPTEPRPPLPDVPPGQLEDGSIVPLGELERLMCDAEFTRMVMTAEGVPLDVGRTQRTYTKELRRAVLTRDRRCMWPGCRIRASWSEVHHLTWFSRGGVTSLSEGICLCSYHHHRVHELDIRITVLTDGFDFHHPDGTHIGTSTRPPPPGPLLPYGSEAAGASEPSVTEPGTGDPSGTKPGAGDPPGTVPGTGEQPLTEPRTDDPPGTVPGAGEQPLAKPRTDHPPGTVPGAGEQPTGADEPFEPAAGGGDAADTPGGTGGPPTPARGTAGTVRSAAARAGPRVAVVRGTSPPPPTRATGPPGGDPPGADPPGPLPSHPGSYATAPTLWDPEPPF